MKAVLISIQPKWCELIASGKKTIEVRKTKPKLETPFKVYIYCTNSKPILGRCLKDGSLKETPEDDFDNYNRDTLFKANSKVIGEFVCDEIKEITADNLVAVYFNNPQENTCLNDLEMRQYAGGKNLFLWHISDLVIYDKPKELSEFTKAGALNYDDWLYGIYNGTTESTYEKYLIPFKVTRPPQSWCYVERLGDN